MSGQLAATSITGLETARRPATTSRAAAARLVKSVDPEAIRDNLRVLRAAAGGRGVMAVVKGDAYRLGAVAVGRLLEQSGVDALAVDTIAEGVELRAAGIRLEILVMDVDVADNAADCLAAELTPTVTREEQVSRYAELARRRGGPVTVWLRTNVGFNRFGPRDERGFEALLEHLSRHRGQVRVAALFAHLSSSAWSVEETETQAATFARRLSHTRSLLGAAVVGSLAATHGLLHPSALQGTSWVRPGIGLYGVLHPASRDLPGWGPSGLSALRPAFAVRARVLDVVTLTSAEGLGYARSIGVGAGRRVASVAVGFSRGITSAAGGLTGLLHGQRCPMVGQPGMDCTQFDVTGVPQARPGDWMTFIGASNGVAKSAEETCEEIGCSLYELMGTLNMPVQMLETSTENRRTTECRVE
jgi:alanine racemase